MESIDTAAQVLVLAGLATLVYGFALGVPLAAARSSAPQAPRPLVAAHLEMLISGPILLSLAATLQLIGFDGAAADLGAVLLSGGTGLLAVGGTLNWRQGVDDQFAARSPGWKCNALAGPVALAGVTILAIGAVASW